MVLLQHVLMILNVFYMPGWTNWAKGTFQQTLSLAFHRCGMFEAETIDAGMKALAFLELWGLAAS